MKTINALTLAAVVMMGLSGCISTGTLSKGELRQQPVAKPIIVNRPLVDLANHWDEHGTRYFIDLSPAAAMTVNRADGVAEILYGRAMGPFWGMIELHRVAEDRTEIRSYAVKGSEKQILRWREQLISSP